MPDLAALVDTLLVRLGAARVYRLAPVESDLPERAVRRVPALAAERYGHVVVEADGNEAELLRIAARVREHRVSVVLSLEGLDAEDQMRAAAAFLGGLFDADHRRRPVVLRHSRPIGHSRWKGRSSPASDRRRPHFPYERRSEPAG